MAVTLSSLLKSDELSLLINHSKPIIIFTHDEKVVRQWKERTDPSIHEGYGMTEEDPTVAYNHYYRHVISSVGTEVPGVEIQVEDQEGN